jgi:sterol desaturase/sphingolipid hydroxylase (fatty acid hydroxylase superfamily)
MLDVFANAISAVQGWLYEQAVQPLLFHSGLMFYNELAYDALEWVVIGALEIALLALALPLLERRYAVEPMSDPRAVLTDVVYTLLHRLGVVPLLAFALITPVADGLESQLRLVGLSRVNVDQVWPGVTDQPLASFLIYLVLLDFADYWMHRAQHGFRWWWELHAVHHSQRQMTFWTDDRNHLLDDLIRGALLAMLAIAIGVAPEQFVVLTVATRIVQSVQHANLRWRWGPFGEWLLVSPSFHRRHHAIGFGHEGTARGCNFAVLFPVWDVVFGTADFRPGFLPTGIRDQLAGRDYGRGFWAQQWLGFRRLFGAG